MRARTIITFLLVVAISLTAVAHPRAGRESLRAASEDESKLTPEEKQEALEFVTRLVERLEATDDFGQIMGEMFVSDFSERLRQPLSVWLPWAFLDKSLAAHADTSDLRRFYVASMNFYRQYFRFHDVVERLEKQSKDNEKEAATNRIEVVDDDLNLPPEIVDVLLSDPIIAELFAEAKKDEENDNAKKDDAGQPAQGGDTAQAASATAEAQADDAKKESEIGIVKTLSQLKGVSETLEKAALLVSKHLASMPPVPPALSNSNEAETKFDIREFDLTTLDESDFGYPADTPVIHIDVMPYCLRLIRIGGQLKILHAALYVD